MKNSTIDCPLRGIVRLCAEARRDLEGALSAKLPNTTYYAVLGRMDALAADAALFVADALTKEQTR